MDVARLMGGPMLANLLYTFVELDLPDRLAAAPATAADLAEASGAHAGALHRMLRALAAMGVLAVGSGGEYTLTPLGHQLRSARDTVRLMGHPVTQQAWAGLLHTARTGAPAFDHALGMDFTAYLDTDPDF